MNLEELFFYIIDVVSISAWVVVGIIVLQMLMWYSTYQEKKNKYKGGE